MQQFPQHKASMLSDFGIRLCRVTPSEDSVSSVSYSHQDDYYIIGLVEGGEGCCIIDFNEVYLSQGDLFLIQPGQVHCFIGSKNAAGWMLFADSSFIGREDKRIFDEFRLFASSVKIDERKMNELKQIAFILAKRIDAIKDELTKTTARRLVEAYIGIVAESVQEVGLRQVEHNHRHIGIVLSFSQLLTKHLAISRSPSYYASLLNISPGYLNEMVKKTTGISATLYIRNELILQAKRLLVHTDLSIKEISNSLGIDDYAYFSRMFTQATGMSPSVFKQKNLK